MVNAIQIDLRDNVAMVTEPVEAGQEILVMATGRIVKAIEPFNAGHKVVLAPLAAGDTVLKYGIPIGRMMTPVDVGGWVSEHNLEDITEELLAIYCREFRDGLRKVKAFPSKDEGINPRTIMAYPRKKGVFGVRNHIMVISTTPETNRAAEAISDATDCTWFVCNKTKLEEGKISEYTHNAMIYTGRNPNIYAVLVLGTDSGVADSKAICSAISETEKPVTHIIFGQDEKQHIAQGISIAKEFQKEAAQIKREPVSMDGFGLAVHCSGSDWTTALNGNASLGVAADHVVANNGKVFMTEWMEWSGSQHLMAEKCASYELGIELLDNLESVRETVLRETGKPVEYMNPAPGNKEGGLTTLVEKSVGTIKKVGNTQIKGLLNYCEQPTAPGVWIPKSDTVWPMSTSIYSSFAGAHVNVHVTGLGWLYFKVAYLPGIRVTGNPETFKNPEFKLDFNAGMMFDGKSLDEVGKLLFEYIVKVAEGEESESEKSKSGAFNMYYYTEDEFGENTDRNQMLPCAVYEYDEKFKAYTDRVK